MSWKDKVALVTGGTRGIGRAVSLALASEGARVYCWYGRDAAAAQALAAEAPSLRVRAVDVTDPEQVRAAVAELIKEAGRLEVLVNSAGLAADGLFATMEEARWAGVVDVNLNGVAHVCRAVVREMIFNRYGRIVNIASLSGVAGRPGQTAYSAAKAGVIGFTKALAQELARYGILVNAVSPGLIETEMTADLPEETRRAMIAQIPLGRAGTADEVARLVTFAASDENTYITGHNFMINGGVYT